MADLEVVESYLTEVVVEESGNEEIVTEIQTITEVLTEMEQGPEGPPGSAADVTEHEAAEDPHAQYATISKAAALAIALS